MTLFRLKAKVVEKKNKKVELFYSRSYKHLRQKTVNISERIQYIKLVSLVIMFIAGVRDKVCRERSRMGQALMYAVGFVVSRKSAKSVKSLISNMGQVTP
jgi:hypothetical protein